MEQEVAKEIDDSQQPEPVVEPALADNKERVKPAIEKILKCIQCGSQTSLLWRQIELGEICNTCFFEVNKLASSQEPESYEYNTRNGGAGGQNNALSNAESKKVRKSTRSTRFKTNLVNLKMTQGKSRRNIFKKTPFKAPSVTATTTTANSLFYKGTYFQIGDIVSLLDDKDDTYYAQIRGLMQDSFCEKSAVLTWLIPTTSSPDPNEKFDASTYLIGPEEELARKLSCLMFVMHAPSNYYHDKTTPYPPPDIMQEDNQLSRYCGFVWTNMMNEPWLTF